MCVRIHIFLKYIYFVKLSTVHYIYACGCMFFCVYVCLGVLCVYMCSYVCVSVHMHISVCRVENYMAVFWFNHVDA